MQERVHQEDATSLNLKWPLQPEEKENWSRKRVEAFFFLMCERWKNFKRYQVESELQGSVDASWSGTFTLTKNHLFLFSLTFPRDHLPVLHRVQLRCTRVLKDIIIGKEGRDCVPVP